MEIFELQPLFEDVQVKRVLPDGKTFVDCSPQYPAEKIIHDYMQQKDEPGFNLKRFVLKNFILPVPHSQNYRTEAGISVEENIERLWEVLTRQPDGENGSLVPLPYPYIVPGGRFGEIYYWDSYFTMLGLKASGRIEMLENMVKNFSYLIDRYGHIPNGNRTYYLSRSQPPFFSLMIELLATAKDKSVLLTYLPQLEKEYEFWMKGAANLTDDLMATHHCVRMPDGTVLNRYWDEKDTPRPESYAADIELANHSFQDLPILFRHLRAGAESGWDYSCRWFKDINEFGTIHTTDIVPVDLNSLLWNLENCLSAAYNLNQDGDSADVYKLRAEKRKAAIHKYCWNNESGFYFDFDWLDGKQKNVFTLAAMYPLFFGLATKEEAGRVIDHLKTKFLNNGGLVSTLHETGQQWDAPNGWAPLQWICIIALEKYGMHSLAKEIAERWIHLNTEVFKRTGKLMEKYNVVNTNLEAGGGEYNGQDGFGWTNGVLLALLKKYKTD